MKTQPRSGGPATEQGKAISSRNAQKHGLTSNKMFVLQNENPEAWAALLAQCVEGYRPATDLEHTYVEAIAFALWRLKRIYAVQTALIDLEMDDQAESFAATFDRADETIRKTQAIRSLLDDSDALTKLSRYETTLQRAHDRAVKNLQTLREMGQPQPAAPAPVIPISQKLRNELEPLETPPESFSAGSPEPVSAAHHNLTQFSAVAVREGLRCRIGTILGEKPPSDGQ